MGYHPRMSKSVTRGSWRWRQRGALRPLSSQRCLVRVAFRPVLTHELIHQEALQALTKEAEAKSVHGGAGGGAWGGRRGCCPLCTRPLHKGWGTGPAGLEAGGRGSGALGRLFCSLACVELFQEVNTFPRQGSSLPS